MKVSLNWIKDFTDVDMQPTELMERISSQLGAIESIEYLGDKYKGSLIVKVVECIKHDRADKLSVCKIDDGGNSKDVARDENGFIQVVCGAPNVKADMLAVWIPPKAIVPASYDKEQFVLESRELRGKISHGMLASPKELAFSDSHEGLLEVDFKVEPGTTFIQAYKLDDYIIELENKMFTHRPDCFGILGIAREISGIENRVFKSPEWYKEILDIPLPKENKYTIAVDNKIQELVPRFISVIIGDVQIKRSPTLIQSFLSRVGIRPINNIVDATNYMMALTGQPLHAYDYDKVKSLSNNESSPVLEVRLANEDEKLTLLNEKEIKLNKSDIVIATDKQVIGLAGVMGGLNTEVDETTKNIILECATFDMYTIRKTAMEHGIFSDAVTRFTKGQSPRQNMAITIRAIKLIKDISHSHQYSQIVDNSKIVKENSVISITPEFVNKRLGTNLSIKDMARILSNVEIIVNELDRELRVSEPFWRTDIEIKEDLVEEIGRLNGYYKLPQELPLRKINPTQKNLNFGLNASIRESLSGAGANEILSSTFIHVHLFEKVNQNTQFAIEIANALSPDLQYYRLSLTPSLLDIVNLNIRANQGIIEDNEFAIYEIGKSHNLVDLDIDRLPIEHRSLAFIFAADNKTAKRKYQGAPYYFAKHYLSYLIDRNNLEVKIVPLRDVLNNINNHTRIHQLISAYDPDRSAAVLSLVDNEFMGVVGEFKNSVKKAFKLPNYCSGFEVDMRLFKEDFAASNYIPLPKFPKINQDICLKVDNSIEYITIFDAIKLQIEENKPKDTYFSLNLVDIFQKDEDLDHKQITLRLIINSYNKTLTTDRINELLSVVTESVQNSLGVERI